GGRERMWLRWGQKCGKPAPHSRAAEPEQRKSRHDRCGTDSDTFPRRKNEKGIWRMHVGAPGKIGAAPHRVRVWAFLRARGTEIDEFSSTDFEDARFCDPLVDGFLSHAGWVYSYIRDRGRRRQKCRCLIYIPERW